MCTRGNARIFLWDGEPVRAEQEPSHAFPFYGFAAILCLIYVPTWLPLTHSKEFTSAKTANEEGGNVNR